jgi:hypothetical protein
VVTLALIQPGTDMPVKNAHEAVSPATSTRTTSPIGPQRLLVYTKTPDLGYNHIYCDHRYY